MARADKTAKPEAEKAATGPDAWFAIRSIEPAGFYRGGQKWVPEPKVVNAKDFSEDDWADIEAEPLIAVVPTEAPAAPAAPTAEGDASKT